MAKIKEIIDKLEEIAPLFAQEQWDNSGWQIRLQKKDIHKIMLCVSITEDILRQTKKKNCEMIISHHPIFFNNQNKEKPIVKELVKNHIPVYSIHTPLDKTKNGTTDSLIKACGLGIDEILNEYTKISYTEISMSEFIEQIKKGLGINKLRVTNYNPEKIIKKIAFCAGSGTSFCEEVSNANCDCFVTADLKYHTALDYNITIIDVGHLEGEKPALELIKNILKNVECEIAKESSPIEIV